ncbi:hypothetical protein [Pseudomonas amygdali]|uniref:hypothetical protein n=1 Tax=Pseudomonas amygdali TaxID=47877 RepID=UPI000AB62191|nr:hypothetical protein [Pseudomonas amygdali]
MSVQVYALNSLLAQASYGVFGSLAREDVFAALKDPDKGAFLGVQAKGFVCKKKCTEERPSLQ